MVSFTFRYFITSGCRPFCGRGNGGRVSLLGSDALVTYANAAPGLLRPEKVYVIVETNQPRYLLGEVVARQGLMI